MTRTDSKHSDDVVLRRVRRDEVEEVRALRLAALAGAPHAFARTYAEEAAQPPAFWEERTRAAAESDGVATFVCIAGGRHVATATCLLPEAPGPAVLVAMWVEPHRRRHGLGGRLIRAAAAWASAHGAAALELVVHVGNDDALRLYETAGFVPLGAPERCADSAQVEQRMTLALAPPGDVADQGA
jgi:GNAT superfamily N-acetyltransferase